ncbi:MAG: AtpZ/AtpI family protein [bacterium]|nr:AtpZ/AtpI family protein [bacterium]
MDSGQASEDWFGRDLAVRGFWQAQARDQTRQRKRDNLSRRLSKQQSASYQGAFEAVLAVPIAIGIGYWCDDRLGSAPVGLFTGAAVGFAAMLLRIVRMRPKQDAIDDGGLTENEGSEPVPQGREESDR